MDGFLELCGLCVGERGGEGPLEGAAERDSGESGEPFPAAFGAILVCRNSNDVGVDVYTHNSKGSQDSLCSINGYST